MEKILIACSKNWFFSNLNIKKFIKKKNIITIKKKEKLNIKNLKRINPSIIFFPHWSFKVPKKILEKYECICFHTSPLPFGRGGSPIQNLILRNKKVAPVCALKMISKIDAGPIYLKKNVSLKGNLNEIFKRISDAIFEMMKVLIKKKINPKKQVGKILNFKRISKKKSQIFPNLKLKEIYDKIRMLDSKEYPNAYLSIGNILIHLNNAKMKRNLITCNAKITKKK